MKYWPWHPISLKLLRWLNNSLNSSISPLPPRCNHLTSNWILSSSISPGEVDFVKNWIILNFLSSLRTILNISGSWQRSEGFRSRTNKLDNFPKVVKRPKWSTKSYRERIFDDISQLSTRKCSRFDSFAIFFKIESDAKTMSSFLSSKTEINRATTSFDSNLTIVTWRVWSVRWSACIEWLPIELFQKDQKFFIISRFLERNPMEHIDIKVRSDSKL